MIRYGLFLLAIFCSTIAFSQSYSYSYIEPCTGKAKTVTVPANSNIAVNYYGNVAYFNAQDFQNGTFTNWMSTISSSNSSSPCDEITTTVVNSVNMTVTQNIISTLTNVTSAATFASQLASGGMGDALANAANNSSTGSSSENKKNKTNNGAQTGSQPNGSNGGQSTGTNGESAGTQGSSPTEAGGSAGQSGGSGTGSESGGGSGSSETTGGSGSGSGTGGSGTGGSGETGSGNNGNPPNPGTEGTGTEKNGGNGNTANAVSNAVESSSGSGGQQGNKVRAKTGSVIGTGDVVVIRSAVDPNEKNQFKFTGSMTKVNTKNTFARGFLGNFTTQVNNSNITFYGAFTKNQRTIIVANSSMMNFDRDFFNTTTAMYSYRSKKLSGMAGLNFTAGTLGKTGFTNLSAVGGGFYMFRPSQKITGTLLVLGIYSPFTQFYEGKWWDSGLLLVPFSSWDLAITKKFKYNISFSGVYQPGNNGGIFNYQILTGGKIAL